MEIRIKVVFGSSAKIIREGNRYIAKINAKPVGGEANRALVDLIASEFNIDKEKIIIKRGHRKRNKVIELNYDQNK